MGIEGFGVAIVVCMERSSFTTKAEIGVAAGVRS
jgi:purine nucleoside phosphorylase